MAPSLTAKRNSQVLLGRPRTRLGLDGGRGRERGQQAPTSTPRAPLSAALRRGDRQLSREPGPITGRDLNEGTGNAPPRFCPSWNLSQCRGRPGPVRAPPERPAPRPALEAPEVSPHSTAHAHRTAQTRAALTAPNSALAGSRTGRTVAPATWPSDPSLPAPAQSRGSGWRRPTLSGSVVWVPGQATPLAAWPRGGLARTCPRAFPPQGSEPKTGAHLRADREAQAPLVGDNEGDDGLEDSGEERVDSEDKGAELLRKRRRDLKT